LGDGSREGAIYFFSDFDDFFFFDVFPDFDLDGFGTSSSSISPSSLESKVIAARQDTR
jgi:hypothetical protein